MATDIERKTSPGKIRPILSRPLRIALIGLIVVSPIILYGITTSLNHWNNSSWDDYIYTHRYAVQLISSTSDDYWILCPVPVTSVSNLAPSGFLDDLILDNVDMELSIVSTEYGMALNVSGHGCANISWYAHWKSESGKFYGTLSMLSTYDVNASFVQAFVGKHGCAVDISLDYSASYMHRNGGSSWEYDFHHTAVDDGWHETSVDIYGKLIY